MIKTELDLTQMVEKQIWNAWDEMAVYKSLTRRPHEHNLKLRLRTLAAKEYGTNIQGMINALSDAFDADKYVVSDKKFYYLVNIPLSPDAYEKINIKNKPEYEPVVVTYTIDSVDTVLTFTDETGNANDTTNNLVKSVVADSFTSFTLWRNFNGEFERFIEVSVVPDSFSVEYSYVENGVVIRILEQHTRLARAATGEIEVVDAE